MSFIDSLRVQGPPCLSLIAYVFRILLSFINNPTCSGSPMSFINSPRVQGPPCLSLIAHVFRVPLSALAGFSLQVTFSVFILFSFLSLVGVWVVVVVVVGWWWDGGGGGEAQEGFQQYNSVIQFLLPLLLPSSCSFC